MSTDSKLENAKKEGEKKAVVQKAAPVATPAKNTTNKTSLSVKKNATNATAPAKKAAVVQKTIAKPNIT